MRRLVHIFLFVTLLGFALSGCRQSAAERRLVEIDTLIAHGDYDSALAQLRAIDTTALSRDELAYHGLLMAHAAYKAYDSAYFDTTWITRARTAYANGGPYDRHIRTLLYSGVTADELGCPPEAMRWYKLTELEARKEDHYYRGFSLMRIGKLYFSNLEDSLAISRFREALPHFDTTQINYTQYCSQLISQSYLKDSTQIDSAMFFHAQSLRLALELGDSLAQANAMMTKAQRWYFDHDYLRAKNYAVKIIHDMGDWTQYDAWQIASQSYAKLNQLDSAEYYLHLAPSPITRVDSSSYFKTQSWIAHLKGDEIHAQRYEILYDSIDDKAYHDQAQPTMMAAEDSACMEHAQQEKRHILLVAVEYLGILLSIFAGIMFLMRRRAKNKDARNQLLTHELEQSKDEITALSKQLIKQVHEFRTRMEQQKADQVLSIEELRQKYAENLRNSLRNIKMHVTKVNRLISASPRKKEHELVEKFRREARISDEELAFWLSDYSTELLAPQSRLFYEDILSRCNLSDTEKVLLKLVALDFSDREIQILFGASREEYSRINLSRIKLKANLNTSIRKTFRKLNKQ